MSIQVTWLGHSTFRIESPEGKVFLVDPWTRNNPMCPEGEKQQKKVDVMLCSHGHFDHIGDAVGIIQQHQPQVVGIFELASWLGNKGAKNVSPMNKGGTQVVENVAITMTHAVHSCGIQEDDGSIVYGGEACGYVMHFSDGLRVYHAGDTAVFSDMKLIRELYSPDVAILPIGDHFTMGPKEASMACQLLKPKAVIPMHYGTFPLLKGRPDALRQTTEDLGIEIITLKPGERRELAAEKLSPVLK
ncbi:MAG TPA: metal-dependent hydrolase [Clostridia bacterium]|nr:metal-dependent hydrolase [Clostridia bacterium]